MQCGHRVGSGLLGSGPRRWGQMGRCRPQAWLHRRPQACSDRCSLPPCSLCPRHPVPLLAFLLQSPFCGLLCSASHVGSHHPVSSLSHQRSQHTLGTAHRTLSELGGPGPPRRGAASLPVHPQYQHPLTQLLGFHLNVPDSHRYPLSQIPLNPAGFTSPQ